MSLPNQLTRNKIAKIYDEKARDHKLLSDAIYELISSGYNIRQILNKDFEPLDLESHKLLEVYLDKEEYHLISSIYSNEKAQAIYVQSEDDDRNYLAINTELKVQLPKQIIDLVQEAENNSSLRGEIESLLADYVASQPHLRTDDGYTYVPENSIYFWNGQTVSNPEYGLWY